MDNKRLFVLLLALIFTAITITHANAASLRVYVHKPVDQGGSLVPGTKVKLLTTGEEKTTGTGGYVEFTGLIYRDYAVEVRYPSTAALGFTEYWGGETYSVNAASVSKDFYRHSQRISGITVDGVAESSWPKTINTGQTVNVRITVKNGESSGKYVKVRLILDRDRATTYDYDMTSAPKYISALGSTYFDFPFTPSQGGAYYLYAVINGEYPSGYTCTDQYPWSSIIQTVPPSPKIVSVTTSSTEITLGELVTITVDARNDGGTADWMGIALCFPDNPPVSNIQKVSDTDFNLGSNVYGPGSLVGYNYGSSKKQIVYPLVEASHNGWTGGLSKRLVYQVKPHKTGTFTFYVKSIASVSEDYSYYDPRTGTRDQQYEYVKVYTVNVVSPPSPKIVSVTTSSTEITLGELVTITVDARNDGGTADWMGIALCFPDMMKTSNIEVLDETNFNRETTWRDPADPASKVGSNYGNGLSISVSYPLVEASSNDWGSGVSKQFTIKVRPEKLGDFRVYIKSVACVDEDYSYHDPSSGTLDQQNEYVHVKKVNIIDPYTVRLSNVKLETVIFPSGKYHVNENVPFSLTIKNLDKRLGPVWPQIILIGPPNDNNEYTIIKINVNPIILVSSQKIEKIIEWYVPDDIYPGTYSVIVGIWDKDPNDLNANRLDVVSDDFTFLIDTGMSYIQSFVLNQPWGKQRMIHIHVEEKDLKITGSDTYGQAFSMLSFGKLVISGYLDITVQLSKWAELLSKITILSDLTNFLKPDIDGDMDTLFLEVAYTAGFVYEGTPCILGTLTPAITPTILFDIPEFLSSPYYAQIYYPTVVSKRYNIVVEYPEGDDQTGIDSLNWMEKTYDKSVELGFSIKSNLAYMRVLDRDQIAAIFGGGNLGVVELETPKLLENIYVEEKYIFLKKIPSVINYLFTRNGIIGHSISDPKVISHETTHFIQLFDIDMLRIKSDEHWLLEGLAEYISFITTNNYPDNYYVFLNNPIDFEPFDRNNELEIVRQYGSAFSFLKHITDNYGQDKLVKIWNEYKLSYNIKNSIAKILGKPYDTIKKEWFIEYLAPKPHIENIIINKENIAIGDAFIITVDIVNNGGIADWMSVAISFPDLATTNNIEIIDDSNFNLFARVYGVGEEAGYSYGQGKQILPSYHLVEASSNDWGSGVSKQFTIKVRPEKLGDFRVYIKSVACVDEDYSYHDPSSGTLDQQNEYVHVKQIKIVESQNYPIAISGGPYSVSEGEVVLLDASKSYDPNNNIHYYEWDLNGDGIYEKYTLNNYMPNTWNDDYEGIIGLRITDYTGLTSTDICKVVVNNIPPVVDAGSDIYTDNLDVSFTVQINDPGNDEHSILWDFGDGTSASNSASPSHTYSEPGVYIVTVTVSDDDGGESLDTLQVTIHFKINIALSVSVQGLGSTDPVPGDYSYAEGTQVSVEADPGEGWVFSHWELDGGDVGSGNPYTVTMDEAHSLEAVFTEQIVETYYLLIDIEGEGSTDPVPGIHYYNSEDPIIVTASAYENWVFKYWELDGTRIVTDGPLTIIMDKNHNLRVVFDDTQDTIIEQLMEIIQELINLIKNFLNLK